MRKPNRTNTIGKYTFNAQGAGANISGMTTSKGMVGV
jgi:hypothetical protein